LAITKDAKLRYEGYASVVKCREMFKHYDTSYIDTSLCYLNIFIMMNKIYETTNYMIHWCVYFIV